MTQRNFKAIVLAAIALMWTAGGAIAQQVADSRTTSESTTQTIPSHTY